MNHDEIAGYTLRSSQELESILATKFGATGNGLIERARSVQSSIPANIFNSILYAGRVRNQFVHDGSAPADMNRYIAAFDEALAWGRNAPSRMTHGGASSTGRPSVLRLFTKWKVIRFVIAVAAALYGLFYGWTSHGVEGIRMMTTPPAMSHRGASRAAAARQPFQALRASEADIRRLSPHRLTPCDGFAV